TNLTPQRLSGPHGELHRRPCRGGRSPGGHCLPRRAKPLARLTLRAPRLLSKLPGTLACRWDGEQCELAAPWHFPVAHLPSGRPAAMAKPQRIEIHESANISVVRFKDQ